MLSKRFLKRSAVSLGMSMALVCMTPQLVHATTWEDKGDPNEMVEIDTLGRSDILMSGYKAKGTDNGCDWIISSEGELKIRASKGAKKPDLRNDEWKQYMTSIRSVDIDVPYSSHLEKMFYGAEYLKSVKIKIDKVDGSAAQMFYKNERLESVDLKRCNMSKVTSMAEMFYCCSWLKSIDFTGIDTSNVTDMSQMFYECGLESIKIDSINTGKVATTYQMFYACEYLEKLDLSKWNTYCLRDARGMFEVCRNLKSLNVKDWDISNLVDGEGLFSCCESLTTIDLSGWNGKRLTEMDDMFRNCTKLKTVRWNGASFPNLEDISCLFCDCSSLTSVDLSVLNTSKVKYMYGMFEGCESLTNINLKPLKTDSVVEMGYMFADCTSLKTLNVDHFNTKNVKDMSRMFHNCKSLKTIDVSNFRTDALQSMNSMFQGCTGIQYLDLRNFDLSHLKEDAPLFILDCDKLVSMEAPKHLTKRIKVDRKGWYRDDSWEKLLYLPQKLNKSVHLHVQEEGNKFIDVRTDHWAYTYIKGAYYKKWMVGTGTAGDDLVIFNSESKMTRAEFVRTLYNCMSPKPVAYKNVFTDVPKGEWYTDAILWAYNEGLVKGIGNKKFGVHDKVTRQDMVTILYNLAGKLDKGLINVNKSVTLNGFADQAKVSSYAKDPMRWAVANKIISGMPSGNKPLLDPTGIATRAQCAKIIRDFNAILE